MERLIGCGKFLNHVDLVLPPGHAFLMVDVMGLPPGQLQEIYPRGKTPFPIAESDIDLEQHLRELSDNHRISIEACTQSWITVPAGPLAGLLDEQVYWQKAVEYADRTKKLHDKLQRKYLLVNPVQRVTPEQIFPAVKEGYLWLIWEQIIKQSSRNALPYHHEVLTTVGMNGDLLKLADSNGNDNSGHGSFTIWTYRVLRKERSQSIYPVETLELYLENEERGRGVAEFSRTFDRWGEESVLHSPSP